MRVVVIGGGAVGSAVALFLKQLGGSAVAVQVVEPDPSLSRSSSALSAGSIRQQFSQPINVRMSQFGHAFIEQVRQGRGPVAEPLNLGFVAGAYLFCASAAGAPGLRECHAAQRAAGAEVALLSADETAARFPWMNTDDLALTSLGLAGEGWLDGYSFARGLGQMASRLGAVWLRGRVVGFERSGPPTRALQAARLDSGERLQADYFVNAAGPWAGALARLAGLDVPVHARRRTVFAMTCPSALPPTPLVIDPSGVWFRSEGSGFIGGWSPGEHDDDPDDLPLDQADLAQFEDRVWPALAQRVPAFEALRVKHAWAGYYEVHPLDHNALIGPHPQCSNLLLCNGFSGHGLQHAPAAGRGLAEWLLHGRYTSLDLSALSPQRILTAQAFNERAII